MKKKETSTLRKVMRGVVVFLAFIAIVKINYDLKVFDVLLGMVKLESRDKKVARVSLKSLSFMTKSDSEDDFIMEMCNNGWEFVNNYGKGYLFARDGQEVLLTKKTYLKVYDVYEVTNRDYFNAIEDGTIID